MTTYAQINVIPEGISWDDWHCALIHDFGSEPLPHVMEEDWSGFANALIALPAFAQFNIPTGDGFDNWQDWARAACNCVNGARS